jgi:PilZ domain
VIFADRRKHVRYEVIGVLRGTLEMSEPVRIQNVTGDGALLETSTPVAVGATQSIQMAVGGQSTRITCRVRHVTPVSQSPNPQYSVGVEFVSPPEALSVSVANLIAESAPD